MKNKDIMAICAALVIASLVLIFLIRTRKGDSYSENSFREPFVDNWIETFDRNGNGVEPSKALKLRISKQDVFWLVEQLDKDGTYKPYPETTNGKYERSGVLTCLELPNYYFSNQENGLIKDQNYHYFKSVPNFDESITKHQPEIKEDMTLNEVVTLLGHSVDIQYVCAEGRQIIYSEIKKSTDTKIDFTIYFKSDFKGRGGDCPILDLDTTNEKVLNSNDNRISILKLKVTHVQK